MMDTGAVEMEMVVPDFGRTVLGNLVTLDKDSLVAAVRNCFLKSAP